jgi:hypothetical protein
MLGRSRSAAVAPASAGPADASVPIVGTPGLIEPLGVPAVTAAPGGGASVGTDGGSSGAGLGGLMGASGDCGGATVTTSMTVTGGAATLGTYGSGDDERTRLPSSRGYSANPKACASMEAASPNRRARE